MNHPIVGARLTLEGAGSIAVTVREATLDGLIATDDGGNRWKVQWCCVTHRWYGERA